MGVMYRAVWIAGLSISLMQSASPVYRAWPISEAPAGLREPISRADLIIVSMQDALLRELDEALDRGGPSWAIGSCHVDVIGLSERLRRYEGIAAGRTSDRVRNPMNTPRAWAAPIVDANAGLLAQDVEGFAVDLGDRVGVMRPMVERRMCASCHGAIDGMEPAVRKSLMIRYPTDRAVGFRDGEIRGWFWTEIAKR